MLCLVLAFGVRELEGVNVPGINVQVLVLTELQF